MSLFAELKRRNVLRVGTAYVVTSWLLIQVAETIFPLYGFGDGPARLVTTVLGIGLVPALVFAWVFELTPEGLKRESEVQPGVSITPQTGRKLDRWIMLVLALALGYFAFDKFVLAPEREAELLQTAGLAAPSDIPAASIAVLPFVNMSSDPDQEYFSDGISEEILNVLAQVPDLHVAGRTSSFAFKGRDDDLREIGALLGVAHVLEGSVRKAGDTIRITAQLIKVDDGFHLWSETFDRELTDVFAIQDEVAAAILGSLKPHLLDTAPGPAQVSETSPEVFEWYLEGRSLIRTRSKATLEAARELLEAATNADPDYAPAWAQLGVAVVLLKEGIYGDLPTAEAADLSKQYLERAVSLDPGLAEGWSGLGLLYMLTDHGTMKESAEMLEKSLTLNPIDVQVLNWLASTLSALGEGQRAMAVSERAIEVDPLFAPNVGNLAQRYGKQNRLDDGWRILDRARAFMPDDPILLLNAGYLHGYAGEWAEALRVLKYGHERTPDNYNMRWNLAQAYNATHQFDQALEIDQSRFGGTALWHLGRDEEAKEMLLQRADSGGSVAPYFQVLNALDEPATLIDYMDSKYGGLETFSTLGFAPDAMMYTPLNAVALAYQRLGDSERAAKALSAVAEGHAKLALESVDYAQFRLNEAEYHALLGDHAAALEHLGAAIDRGYIGPARIAALWPALLPLEAYPEYQAIQQRMMDNLNAERAKLGLEPVSD